MATFYRAVSFAELADFRQTGTLRSRVGSCEGKHFALSIQDANHWGESFYGSGRFALIQIDIDDAVAATFMRWNRIDGIGPACFATIDQLEGAKISEVMDEP